LESKALALEISALRSGAFPKKGSLLIYLLEYNILSTTDFVLKRIESFPAGFSLIDKTRANLTYLGISLTIRVFIRLSARHPLYYLLNRTVKMRMRPEQLYPFIGPSSVVLLT